MTKPTIPFSIIKWLSACPQHGDLRYARQNDSQRNSTTSLDSKQADRKFPERVCSCASCKIVVKTNYIQPQAMEWTINSPDHGCNILLSGLQQMMNSKSMT